MLQYVYLYLLIDFTPAYDFKRTAIFGSVRGPKNKREWSKKWFDTHDWLQLLRLYEFFYEIALKERPMKTKLLSAHTANISGINYRCGVIRKSFIL